MYQSESDALRADYAYSLQAAMICYSVKNYPENFKQYVDIYSDRCNNWNVLQKFAASSPELKEGEKLFIERLNRLKEGERKAGEQEKQKKEQAEADRLFLADKANMDKALALLKNSYFAEYPQAQRYKTVQKAFEGFFDRPTWEIEQNKFWGGWVVTFNGIACLITKKLVLL